VFSKPTFFFKLKKELWYLIAKGLLLPLLDKNALHYEDSHYAPHITLLNTQQMKTPHLKVEIYVHIFSIEDSTSAEYGYH